MIEYIVIFKFTHSTHFKYNGFIAFLHFHLVLIALGKKTHEKPPLYKELSELPLTRCKKQYFCGGTMCMFENRYFEKRTMWESFDVQIRFLICHQVDLISKIIEFPSFFAIIRSLKHVNDALEIYPWATIFQNFSLFAIFEIPLTCSKWAFFWCPLSLYIHFTRFCESDFYL